MLPPLALIVPRPSVPPPTSAPRTPNRSPVAPHILLSPPAANRNSTDSWNSSNYDLEDLSAVWKEEQLRLLSRTLDALPAHLITPFNGPVPPSNLLDRIARGILVAKGPNDWPHSIRATRIKLLELARRRAQEERRKAIMQEECAPLSFVACQGDTHRARTPDSAEVLQPRTNTPIHVRRPVYRQSSMDFLDPDQSDRSESIARLSTRLQRHDRVLHHPYLRPTHSQYRTEHNRSSPSTPSSSTLNSNRRSGVRKSTISASSASSSSFGSPMSVSAPLRPSSLRRASTLTLASTDNIHVDAGADAENISKNADLGRTDGCPEASVSTKVVFKIKRVPSYNGTGNATPPVPSTPASKPKRPKSTPLAAVTSHRKTPPNPTPGGMKPLPRTPPNEPHVPVSEKPMLNRKDVHTKFRKGHRPQVSVSSDEEEKIRSQTVKKVRTRAPSWSIPLASAAHAQPSLLLSSALPREKEGSDSGRSISTGIRSKKSTSSSSSTDNDLSTASTETAATTVSISSMSASQAKPKSPRNVNQVPPLTPSPMEVKKPARRNLARNLSVFGHELPCPQRTPVSPSRIPVSSPIPLSPSVNCAITPSTSSTSTSPVSSRPRTLRRAARRISFGSVATNGNMPNQVENPRRPDGEAPALGSAFQLA